MATDETEKLVVDVEVHKVVFDGDDGDGDAIDTMDTTEDTEHATDAVGGSDSDDDGAKVETEATATGEARATGPSIIERSRALVAKAPGASWVTVAAAMVLGISLGAVVPSGRSVEPPVAAHVATHSDDDPTDVVGVVTYGGTEVEITAGDVDFAMGRLFDAGHTESGGGRPSADDVVAFMRTTCLAIEAESMGISATDADVDEYVKTAFGTDIHDVARRYGCNPTEARDLARPSALAAKLKERVTAGSSAAPEAPERVDGIDDENARVEDYYDYVIDVMGDAWDEKGKTIVDRDWADALKDNELAKGKASYDEAKRAYGLAYSIWANSGHNADSVWVNHVNGVWAQAKAELMGITS